MTEGEEFHKIYKLEVVAIPTNQPMIRDDDSDLVFRNENGKFSAVIDEIEEMTGAGRPILVGTVSVEKSEILGELLRRRGIRHEVLNAKFHEKEAGIVAQAGRTAAVTIATNMAGRGTDIVLGGNPAGLTSDLLHQRGLNPAEVDKATYDEVFREAKARCDAEHEVVVAAGGLHIIGTERHESRRIDNQLRGRAGRQGDPGSSRFYLSLDDDLMKRFASDRVAGLMERLGLEDDVAIESRLVSKTIESAQSRVEGFNFDIRKRVVEFDDVINKQRETIYAERDKVLHNEDLTDTVRAFLDDELGALLDQHCAGEHPDDWGMEALSMALRAMGLDGPGTSEDELWEVGGREALAGHLRELAETQLEAREAGVGEVDWAMVERLVLLRTIDSLWVEHLTELDDMRRGIGLRGYAQQDPLNEFKKEAFSLYDQLQALIRRQVATTIFRVQVVKQPPAPTPDEAQLAANLTAGAAAMTSAPRAPRAAGASDAVPVRGSGVVARGLPTGPAIRAMQQQVGDRAVAPATGAGPGAKLGRNDPCHCGSGLKYKKCHGR
jgi:preprotein translocase subunit SecA